MDTQKAVNIDFADIEQRLLVMIRKVDFMYGSYYMMWDILMREPHKSKKHVLEEMSYPVGSVFDESFPCTAAINSCENNDILSAIGVCDRCPMQWKDGRCHTLNAEWNNAKTDEERAKVAQKFRDTPINFKTSIFYNVRW